MSESGKSHVKALVFGGKTGMLGQSLVSVLREQSWDVTAQSREDVNILDHAQLRDYIHALKPDYIFNAIAYTQVDQAEDEPEQALRVNKEFPASLGRVVGELQCRLVHYSTDFVFDGKHQKTPYQLSDEPNPLCVYGSSKLAGENALLRSGLIGLCIIRTAWLFGPGKNFVKTILNLAKERDQLNVVHDQIGSPTYTLDLARYTHELITHKVHGIYHLVNSGQASWCELAAEAVNLAGLNCQINAIPSTEYPQKATRPGYSALSTEKFTAQTGVAPRPWVQALRDYVFLEMSQDDNGLDA